MLESWDFLNGIYLNQDATDPYVKSDHHPLSISNNPLFHHSIIPLFHLESKINTVPLGCNQGQALWTPILYHPLPPCSPKPRQARNALPLLFVDNRVILSHA